jgi:hypothetical protein
MVGRIFLSAMFSKNILPSIVVRKNVAQEAHVQAP